MKTLKFLFLSVLFSSFGFTTLSYSLKLKPSVYKADVSSSRIYWKGFKPTGFHNGSLTLKEGFVNLENNQLKDGKFVMDMKSIKVLDLPSGSEGNTNLTNHLKSPDFFDVNQHATAIYEFYQVETAQNQTVLKGNLTIKGIKKTQNIPVKVTYNKDQISLKADPITIDRTDYNIQYKSNKFFDNLKDKFINDEFEVSFDVILTNK